MRSDDPRLPLDDTSWLVPVAHFNTRSAQSLISPAADAACYETQPSDVRTLAQAWRARWP